MGELGLIIVIVLTLAAYVGSTISGIVGMAGGILLLTIMYIVGLDPLIAIPIHAMVQLFSNSTRVLVFFKHVKWVPLIIVVVVALPLPWVGLKLLVSLDKNLVKVIMGILVLYATWTPKWGVQKLPQAAAFGCVGVLGGVLGVVAGATGPLIAPFFIRKDLVKEQVIATKAVVQSYFHILKIIYFWAVPTVAFAYQDYLYLIVPMTIAVVLGTLTGKKLLGKIPDEDMFRTIYKAVLTVVALYLVGEAVRQMVGYNIG